MLFVQKIQKHIMCFEVILILFFMCTNILSIKYGSYIIYTYINIYTYISYTYKFVKIFAKVRSSLTFKNIPNNKMISM